MIFRFLHPALLVALAGVPLLIILARRTQRSGRPRVVFSDLTAFKSVPPSMRVRLRHSLLALRVLVVAVLVFALARPQHGNQMKEILSKGIDIMIVLDCSGSMRETDLEPNRLGAAKLVAQNFIDGREKGLQNDRIGLVAFSRIAFTKCPLTVDYTILKKILDRVDFTRKEYDGTAIGDAIGTAVARMEDSKAKSKVLIVVTDGQNNAGMDPMTAAALAQAVKVKIYTIGVVPSTFMSKVQDKIFGDVLIPSMPQVDETQMKAVAEQTGGQYFRAQDEKGLAEIFAKIDQMEKTEVKVKEFYRYSEMYRPWIVLALGLLLVELAASRTVLRRLP
jgi:Ca-activated chloride channel homolog